MKITIEILHLEAEPLLIGGTTIDLSYSGKNTFDKCNYVVISLISKDENIDKFCISLKYKTRIRNAVLSYFSPTYFFSKLLFKTSLS